MTNENTEQSFLKSVKGKIFFGFLIGTVALTASYYISKAAFDEVEETVSQISTPNERLRLINAVFQDILQLNQIQNTFQTNAAGVFSQEETRLAYLTHSDRLKGRLDSLGVWFSDSPDQLARLDSIREMLDQRAITYNAYMLERRGLATSTALKKKVNSISEFIETSKGAKGDSTVVTTEKRTTTTTITKDGSAKADQVAGQPATDDSKRGFWSKVFKGKKTKEEEGEEEAAPQEPVVVKKEEVKVSIDTLVVARKDSAIEIVGEELKTMARNQMVRANRFFERERQLQLGETLLIGKLMEVTREVEADVLNTMYRENEQVKHTIGKSIKNIGVILLVVLTLTALLIFWISADLSRSNEYRKQLILAKEEADYHSEAKQRFLANMSHEIRTPLQSIIGFSEVARSQDVPDKSQLEIIHKSSEHLLYLVNEILDYSRIVSDSFEFVDESFEIGQVLEEVVEILRPQAESKGLALTVRNKFATPTFVSGDAFRLKQILHNLIGNAIKFTKSGGVRLLAESVVKNGRKEIRLEVRDTGIGMTSEQIRRVFNQFEQGHAGITPEYGGSGLGLSIVNALVTGQGGRIQVESRLDEYSAFIINLPFREGVPIPKLDVQPQEDDCEDLIFDGKAWVVDDDKYILQWVRTILDQCGVQVTAFSSPLEADQAVWDPDVKVLFIDMRMPGMSGAELCSRLKKKAAAGVRFVACTAMALPEERKNMMEMGFDEVLMKPFKKNDIFRVLNQSLPVMNNSSAKQPVAGDAGRPDTEAVAGGMDLSGLISMTMGDEELLRESLGQFVEDTLADLASVEDYLKVSGSESHLRELFHRLAGRTAQVGAVALGSRMREIEIRLAEKEAVDREEIDAILQSGYQIVEEIQEKYVS